MIICGGSSYDKDVCPVRENTKKCVCANCGGDPMSNFWDGLSRRLVVEARTRQMNDNFRYGYGSLQSSPGRVSNNTHFSVHDRLIKIHTHQVNYNHAH